MARSPEFPELAWMPPRSFTRGRKSGQPSVIVIHTTEGSEGPRSAEDGAAYDQRRTDGTSAHFYVDSNGIVQCVRTTDEAHTQAGTGNDIGISIEICGRAGQSSAQWGDVVSRATIRQTARLCAMLLKRYPRIEMVRLSPTDLRAGRRWGFTEHKAVSLAWGETDHTDPGPNFPWGLLFSLIMVETGKGDSDMTPSQAYVQHVMNYRLNAVRANAETVTIPAREIDGHTYPEMTETNQLAVKVNELSKRIDDLIEAVAALASEDTDAL